MKMLIPVSTNHPCLESRSTMNRASLAKASSPGVWGRKAFTLIELLIVIAVISILASLLVVGVNKAINFSRQVGVKTEMAQIELALANAARELGNVPYIPSGIILCEDYSQYQTLISDSNTPPAQVAKLESSRRILSMMFPNAWRDSSGGMTVFENWDGNPGSTGYVELKADQAWVFFLGGIPTPTDQVGQPALAGPNGFARSGNPAALPTVAPKRKGPYYDFKPSRLIKQGNGFYSYCDSWEAKTKVPLIVYNNISRDPSVIDTDNPGVTFPGRYFSSSSKFFNPKGYQIISAGKDGIFGLSKARKYNNPAPVVFDSYGDIDVGSDDQANFSDSVLAKPVD